MTTPVVWNGMPAADTAVKTGMLSRPPAVGPARSTPPSPNVPCYVFTTEDLPPGDRFAAWARNSAPVVELSPVGETPADFHGHQILWDLGGLGFSRVRTDEMMYSSSPRHVQSRPLDHWVMTLLLSGYTTTTTATHTFDCLPGVVQIHTLGHPFRGSVSDSEMLTLWIPRDFCRDMSWILDAAEFTTLDTAMGRMLTAFMIGLAHQVTCMHQDELPRLLSAMREMIIACVTPGGRMEEDQGAIFAVPLERARQFIQSNLYDPKLGAEMLMRELAISRTRLYRLFEPAGGVNHYIRHRRLLDAHSALANPNEQRRIVEIAEQRGFEGAEFSRAFKREFGYTPSDVRRGERIGAPSHCGADLASLQPEERLGALLWRLQNGGKDENRNRAMA